MQAFLAKSGPGKKASRVPFRLSKSTETAFPASESVCRANTLLTRPIRFSFSDIVSTDVYDGGHRLNVMKDRWSIKDSPQAGKEPTSQTRDVGRPRDFA